MGVLQVAWVVCSNFRGAIRGFSGNWFRGCRELVWIVRGVVRVKLPCFVLFRWHGDQILSRFCASKAQERDFQQELLRFYRSFILSH